MSIRILMVAGSRTISGLLLVGALFLSAHWVRVTEAQTNLSSGGSNVGRAFELVILDRSGLTRYSASVKGVTDVVVSVSSAQFDGLLTHVDGLSAPIRGTRIDASTIRFGGVAPGTWRVSLVNPGTDTPAPGVNIVSIRGE